jgi:hypothetical protein
VTLKSLQSCTTVMTTTEMLEKIEDGSHPSLFSPQSSCALNFTSLVANLNSTGSLYRIWVSPNARFGKIGGQ